VTSVTNTSISLAWVPYEDSMNDTATKYTDFLVQFGKVNNMTMYETILKLDNVSHGASLTAAAVF
jgi:hypothetical protein